MISHNIINERQLRQLVDCGFVHRTSRQVISKNWSKDSKEARLKTILKAIKDNSNVTRHKLAKILSISNPTLDKYLNILLESGEVTKELTGRRGKEAYLSIKE